MYNRFLSSAFSLVELSIVLVILGLLTGGILGGQALIRAAELRAVSLESARYITAIQTFRDKYFALPGDMTNATAFWGALDGGNGVGSDCRGESSSLLTCNGNGDGQLCVNADCPSFTYEAYLFWKHLANAGLIEGTYSGAAGLATSTICYAASASQAVQGGCNVPRSRLSSAGWIMNWAGTAVGHSNLFDGQYGNILQLSGMPTAPVGLQADVLRPEELWNLDSKVDDGLPGTGMLTASRWSQCTTGAASTADFALARYRLTHNVIDCVPVFRGF